MRSPRYCKPPAITVDHGTEFTSAAIKGVVLSADYWDSARRGPRARTIAAVFRSHGEQSAGVATKAKPQQQAPKRLAHIRSSNKC